MKFEIGNLEQLHWLWLMATTVIVSLFAIAVGRRAAGLFATPNLHAQILPPANTIRRLAATILVTLTMILLVLALIDIRWGNVWREVPQKGIEVMFVLDVSRSMLAEDATPNRLARAKQQIKDTLDEMAGDRVGLVVFAGDAKQQIPLTSHYEDFKIALDEVGPHNVLRGGSRLGEAIELASKAFLSKTNDHKAMVVFTDGEDQESQPLESARRAFSEHGVRIFTVGLGDLDQGARIPIPSEDSRFGSGRIQRQQPAEYLQYDGKQVWSKLDGEILRQIATETDGAYIPAGTKQVNMADVYHGYVANVEQQEFETAKFNRLEARFQWFLALGLILLIGEVASSTWPTRVRNESSPAAASSYQGESRSDGSR